MRQCDESAQNMEDDKPWENEGLKKIRASHKASRPYKAKTGVGCHVFHTKVPLGLAKGTRGEIVEFLKMVGTKWKIAATSLHDDVLLDGEDCHE